MKAKVLTMIIALTAAAAICQAQQTRPARDTEHPQPLPRIHVADGPPQAPPADGHKRDQQAPDRREGDRREAGQRREGPPRGPREIELTPQQQQEMLDWLKQHRPDQHKRLMESQEQRPQRFQAALRMLWPWYENFRRMPEEIQKQALIAQDSRFKVWQLASAIRSGEGDADQLKAQLREEIARLFDAEQHVQKYELEQMEARLAKLKDELKQRQQRRNEVLAERFNQAIERSADRPPREGPEGRPERPEPRGDRGPDAQRRGDAPRQPRTTQPTTSETPS